MKPEKFTEEKNNRNTNIFSVCVTYLKTLNSLEEFPTFRRFIHSSARLRRLAQKCKSINQEDNGDETRLEEAENESSSSYRSVHAEQ